MLPRSPRVVAANGTIRYEFFKAWADLSIRCVVQTPERGSCRLRPGLHRLDESAASYSSAGWSPPEPASASPAESHSQSISRNCKPPPHEGWGIFDRRNEEFSTGVDTRKRQESLPHSQYFSLIVTPLQRMEFTLVWLQNRAPRPLSRYNAPRPAGAHFAIFHIGLSVD
jgi:hypothetical protein